MVTEKLLLLLVMLPAQHYSMTPPNARPPSGELRKQVGWELVIPRVAMLLRALLWSWALLECVGLFAATDYCPPGLSQSIVHHLVRSGDPQRTLTHISSLTPTFLVGSVLSIFGSFLRIHCYGTLGSMFTFELSIRKEHKLITSGAYAIVRHPSYTGGLGTGIGLFLCILSPNLLIVALSSLFPDSDSKIGMTNVLRCTCVSVFVGLSLGLVHRMNNEDAMLEKNFGEEWKEWARRVPYRLIPWVY
ncbi:hypothetical protein PAXRUDRAFT_417269 [Paxillus rubicundulus Ve08.2h10]|uniref:Protein-S-isoprenylcysteine O-methyltransferase n=1 Tax=Paxillus rubicundulus Ve08.2h10 TaxID=930991 RepID=A0A0D0DCL9_9AGAM|nr:hypothetical protein PAXRUDRAFT_417269 [Paxillus rubicundulus Ve08.2h10]